jgi:hypothetical protein
MLLIGATVVVVAAGSATQNSSTSPWVGLDGWNSASVEQIGIDQNCNHGKLTFAPWVEMYPADSIYFSERVKPGDGIQPVATFAPLRFSALAANGKPPAASGTLHGANLMRGNTKLTTESKLTTNAFTITWLHT